MNYQKLIIGLVGLCAVVMAVVFLVKGKGGGNDSPYRDLIEMQKLPFESLHLRGEERVKGQDEFDRAMDFYAKDDYSSAIPQLKKAIQIQPDSMLWQLYLGVCYYLTEDAKLAVATLEQTNRRADESLKPHTRWYLALSRLMAGERDPAEELFEKLVQEKTEYAAKARDMLLKLRKSAAVDYEGKPWVSYPQGGERFVVGQAVTVQWSFDAPMTTTRYRVLLSTDGGVTYANTLAQGIDPAETQWVWPSAAVHGEKLCFRVDAVTPDSVILGVKSESFAVSVVPWITLAAPAPGKALRSGIDYKIEWKVVGAPPLEYGIIVEQLKGSEYEEVRWVESGIAPEQTSTWWYNGLDEGSGYRLVLRAEYTDTTIRVESAKDFAVRAPVTMWLTEPTPTYEEGWKQGDPLAFKWELEGELPHGYTVQLCDTVGEVRRILAQNMPDTVTAWKWDTKDVAGIYVVKILAHYAEGDLVRYTSSPVFIAPSDQATAMTPRRAAALPGEVILDQNFPNPFNSRTTIRFETPQSGHVKLTVFNVMGQTVKVITDKPLPAGAHTADFDAANLASGTYIYQLETAGNRLQKKMILTK